VEPPTPLATNGIGFDRFAVELGRSPVNKLRLIDYNYNGTETKRRYKIIEISNMVIIIRFMKLCFMANYT
jgi:hypothetical protein